MAVYMICVFNVTDPEGFAPYGAQTAPLVAKHNGTLLTADFDAKLLEGTLYKGNVVVQFPSEEDAMAFYDDPDYDLPRMLRVETTSDVTMVLVKAFTFPQS